MCKWHRTLLVARCAVGASRAVSGGASGKSVPLALGGPLDAAAARPPVAASPLRSALRALGAAASLEISPASAAGLVDLLAARGHFSQERRDKRTVFVNWLGTDAAHFEIVCAGVKVLHSHGCAPLQPPDGRLQRPSRAGSTRCRTSPRPR
jgi:hypothetical protein